MTVGHSAVRSSVERGRRAERQESILATKKPKLWFKVSLCDSFQGLASIFSDV